MNENSIGAPGTILPCYDMLEIVGAVYYCCDKDVLFFVDWQRIGQRLSRL